MREHYNWSVGTEAFYVVFKPFELIVAELAQTAGLEIQHVN